MYLREDKENHEIDKYREVGNGEIAIATVVVDPITGEKLSTIPTSDIKMNDVLISLASLLTELKLKVDPNESQLTEVIPMLRTLILVLANPSYVDKAANQLRAQITGSLTTLTTLTGLTNIDGLQGKTLLINQGINAWANCCRSRIS